MQSKIGVLSNWSKIQDGGFGVGFPFSAAAASSPPRLNPLQQNVFLQTEKCICPNWKMYLSKLINEFIRNTECTCWKDGGLGVGFAFFLLLLTRPAWTRSESLNPAPEIWFSDRFSLKFDEEIFHISWHLFHHHTITILKQFVEDNLMIIDKNDFDIQDLK